MKANQIRRIVEVYQRLLDDSAIEAEDYPVEYAVGEGWQAVTLQHIAGMLPKIVNFTRQNEMAKAQRWLGFVQAILWANGLYSIGEMARHNRSE